MTLLDIAVDRFNGSPSRNEYTMLKNSRFFDWLSNVFINSHNPESPLSARTFLAILNKNARSPFNVDPFCGQAHNCLDPVRRPCRKNTNGSTSGFVTFFRGLRPQIPWGLTQNILCGFQFWQNASSSIVQNFEHCAPLGLAKQSNVGSNPNLFENSRKISRRMK